MLEHRYGKNFHILNEPYLLTLLAKLCQKETVQPEINRLVESIYTGLLRTVVDREFPSVEGAIPSRMVDLHPEAVIRGPVVRPETRVVSVNLARAGTLPSHVCYSTLNEFMKPVNVRQDHISISRQIDSEHHVTGSHASGHKIGGPVKDAIVLFPDPMAATGSTMVEAVGLYRNLGRPLKIIGMHCIVTPEYLKRVSETLPELIVYAVRLDRGLSPPDVLKTVPGTRWSEERGLNANSYIVPGGGGFGEVMNNSFV